MPEPVLVAIAAAIAGKTAGSLYEFVKKRFAGRREAAAALAAAAGADPDSPEVHRLSEELARTEQAEPEFGKELRAAWREISQRADDGGVVNQVSGSVSGNVVQARDIRGGIRF